MSEQFLEGASVLILEDDFYQAHDTRECLEEVGARILGPFSDAADAIAAADQARPDYAIVDVNLGRGMNFAPARALMARGVRVLFVTGYDETVLPDDMQQAPCLQKPAPADRIVTAVRGLSGRPT